MRMRRGRREPGDGGMTTIELIVAMGIFTVVCVVFLTGVVMMTRSTVRASSQSQAVDSSRIIFQRLDRQVRYAESVNAPGTGAGGAQYVEFRISATVSDTGVARCYQWRYDPSLGSIAWRTWDDTAGTAPGAFTTVATDILPAPTGYSDPYPFTFQTATSVHTRQELSLRLRAGTSIAAAAVDTESSFVARNSSASSQSNTLDGSGQSSAPVCLSVATRS